jgi:hypothetical protein
MRSSLLAGCLLAMSCEIVAACVANESDDASVPSDAATDSTVNDAATEASSTDGSTTGPINGTLLSIDGVPLTSTVEINGVVATADVNGHFTLPDPGPVYTATLSFKQESFSVRSFVVFQGLTRRDPTLEMPVELATSSATVSGFVANSGAGLADGRLAFAPKAVIGVNASVGTVIRDGGAFGPTDIAFPGAAQTGQLIFFQHTYDDAGAVNGYPAVAINQNVGLSATGSFNEFFDASAPSGVGSISGAVNAPAAGGWVVSETSLQAIFAKSTPINLESKPVSVFSFLAPNINGVALMVNSTASDTAGEISTAWKTNLSVETSGVALTLPTAPVVASPAPNSSVSLATATFAYHNVTGVAFATLQCESAAAGADGGPAGTNYIVHVVTTAPSIVAPQDPALSLSLPPSASPCSFRVAAMSAYASVDDAAGPRGYADSFASRNGSSAVIYAIIDGSYAVSSPLALTAQ